MIFLQLAIALIAACGVVFFVFFGLVAFGFSCSIKCDFLATAPIVLGCAGVASILVAVAGLAIKRIKSIKSTEVNLKKSFNLRETLLLVMRAWLVAMAIMVTMFFFMN